MKKILILALLTFFSIKLVAQEETTNCIDIFKDTIPKAFFFPILTDSMQFFSLFENNFIHQIKKDESYFLISFILNKNGKIKGIKSYPSKGSEKDAFKFSHMFLKKIEWVVGYFQNQKVKSHIDFTFNYEKSTGIYITLKTRQLDCLRIQRFKKHISSTGFILETYAQYKYK